MERTGNIFDPEYYMLDIDTSVVYRKEQFAAGTLLPVELIVRDRRYQANEIVTLCTDAGLAVDWSHFVRSGHWDQQLEHENDRAKEILVCCSRSS